MFSYFQIEDISEPNLIYACIFLLRMKLLESRDLPMYQRLTNLMQGNTNDLWEEASFSSEVVELLQNQMKLEVTRENVIQLMGIKRTNASTLVSIGQEHNNVIGTNSSGKEIAAEHKSTQNVVA